jgi:hypothetical protein
MEALTPTPLVHYFDPLLHHTLCGAGIQHRSTKHPRAVTCQTCVGLLDERRASSAGADADAHTSA